MGLPLGRGAGTMVWGSSLFRSDRAACARVTAGPRGKPCGPHAARHRRGTAAGAAHRPHGRAQPCAPCPEGGTNIVTTRKKAAVDFFSRITGHLISAARSNGIEHLVTL
ncbi:hypothetical protein GCM10010254_62320 [Streptomyces chromofuscus]|nr:hypothetical protein GCM10010254_62320 [Streptomyces chromofuscus]